MKLAMNHPSGNEQLTATSQMAVGSQIFHNGVPVQLLYRIDRDKHHETWRVRPLFVEAADRNEQFHPPDAISFLHTMRAPA